MKKLGFGCMRLPLKNKKINSTIDFAQSREMFRAFLDEGFTYFDTAYMYHDGFSERMVKKALSSLEARDTFLLADKMPVGMCAFKKDAPRIFASQKKKCGVEYFDYYLLHALNKSGYEKAVRLGIFDYLGEKKKAGEIRRLGFSFHDTAEVLDRILTEQPQMEFVQLQINYLDWEDEGVQSRLCYEVARKHGKDIIVMEPVKGGALAKVPDSVKALLGEVHPDWSPARWAVSFCASLEGVICVLSGMSDMAQLQDNMGYMKDFTPLTDGEIALLHKAADMIRNAKMIACTSCRYCVSVCPKEIPIPEYFAAYNRKTEGKADYRKLFDSLTDSTVRAGECISCRQCEGACPQHILISEKLGEMKNLIK